ncbi:MAG: EI24 domain-containing protein [Oligoflexia bacterium]|nr:EI24 domain-containing protein [Oligoflexia bacterium]
MKDFLKGIGFYFRGEFFAFTTMSIRKTIFLNILLNIILFFLTFGVLSAQMVKFLKFKMQTPDVWYDYLKNIGAYGLGALLVILASGVIVYALSSIIMVGVGDYLSKKTLMLKGALPKDLKSTWNIRRIFGILLKVTVLVSLSLMFFVVSLIPGLGFIGMFLAALVMTFDMLDYGFDHYHLTLKQRFSFFKANIKVLSGYAFAMMFLLVIPGFNILMLPGSVVAASVMLAEIKRTS